MNEKFLRLLIIIFVCVLHLALILLLVFETKKTVYEPEETARVMKVTDLSEYEPPPIIDIPIPVLTVSSLYSEIPQTSGIAEYMIETETPITVVSASDEPYILAPAQQEYDYLAMHQISKHPKFNESAFMADVVYPPIALRSGIEGRVTLELFVDRTGVIVSANVVFEEPEGRGFGEAAVKAFIGKKGEPAYANNEPVSSRYRYPFYFTIR